MKLKNMLIVNSIVALVYGVIAVVAPATMLSVYGGTQGPSEKLMTQFFGVSLIGLGLITWLARNVADPEAQRSITLASVIADVIGVIVSVIGTVSGAMSAVGWSAVAIYVLLAAGFAYFLFVKPSEP